jgi:hypothetical protein
MYVRHGRSRICAIQNNVIMITSKLWTWRHNGLPDPAADNL